MCCFISIWQGLFPLPYYLTFVVYLSFLANLLALAHQAVNKFPQGADPILSVSAVSWFFVWAWLSQTV